MKSRLNNDQVINKKEGKKNNNMLVRTVVGVAGIIFCCLILFKTPLWCSTALVSVIALLMAYEMSFGTGLVKNKLLGAIGVVAGAVTPWFQYVDASSGSYTVFMFVLLVASFLCSVFYKENTTAQEIVAAVFSATVLPFIISLVVSVLKHPNGAKLVIIPFIASWGADSLAYTVGTFFGKTKMFPEISPNKTVEGAVAGLAGGVLGMVIYGIILALCHYTVNWLAFILLGLAGAVFGMIGDLFFSYLKRSCKIKDFGKLLPGHGGILDRFDSVVFVLPMCWCIFELWEVVL